MYSLYVWIFLWIPWEIIFSFNPILLFCKYTFKLVTTELSSTVICDSYWPWIFDQPHSFYLVSNFYCFLIIILRYVNHPVTGSIIVISFQIIVSLPFVRILEGPMRSTHSLLHGISSSSSAGILTYFYWTFFTLAYATFRDFFIDISYNVWPVTIFSDIPLYSIHYCMKEIHVIPFKKLFLE